MKYLIDLKNALLSHFDELTGDNTQLHINNGELPADSNTATYIARFELLNCRVVQPFDVLGFIRLWFAGLDKDVPQLKFECNIIDLETYDITVDILLKDKLTFTNEGAIICDDLVWSDAAGTFIKASIIHGDV